MTTLSPMVTPPFTVTQPPIQTLLPTVMGFAVLQPGIADIRIERMARAEQAHARPEHDVVAEADVALVEHDELIIRIEIFAQIDMAAVVAAEGRLDLEAASRSAQQAAQQGGADLRLRLAVELPEHPDGMAHLGRQLLIHKVELSGEHSFFLCHLCSSVCKKKGLLQSEACSRPGRITYWLPQPR